MNGPLPADYADGYVPPARFRTVVTVDGSVYLRWQTDLLARSHKLVGQPGPLTRLWADENLPTPFGGETIWCPEATAGQYISGHYPPINRPSAIANWLSTTEPDDEVILILDPDCLFLSRLVDCPQPGAPIAQPYWILNPKLVPAIAKRHCRDPEAVDSVGIPLMIQRSDLASVAPLWLEKTRAILEDRVVRDLAGRGTEMWGYVLACADLGLRHVAREMQVLNLEDQLGSPILHYSLPIKPARFDGWGWNKQAYRPWSTIDPPPPGVPQGTVAVVDAINAWAAENPYSLE